MPGWKRDIGKRVDEIVGKVVPTVQKAVKWNTPLYGEDDGYFMSIYCYKNFVAPVCLKRKSADWTNGLEHGWT